MTEKTPNPKETTMGSSRTPTFRVEFSNVLANGRRVHHTPNGWDTKRCGRPSDATLAAYVEAVESSPLPGGANEHLGVTRIGVARIVRQATGDVVAEYAAPLFSVEVSSALSRVVA